MILEKSVEKHQQREKKKKKETSSESGEERIVDSRVGRMTSTEHARMRGNRDWKEKDSPDSEV